MKPSSFFISNPCLPKPYHLHFVMYTKAHESQNIFPNFAEHFNNMNPFDVAQIRQDFPILERSVYNKPLVYLDNGASSQKPNLVIEGVRDYYAHEHANIHRGVHHLSQVATDKYEQARETITKAINAKHSPEVIFTKGATESINLVAFSFGELLQKGDEILISHMEHHANIVPWQMLCERKGTVLKVIPMLENGTLDLQAFDTLLTEKTKLLAVVHISNSLGTVNPVKMMIQKAHAVGAKVLIDAAQSIQHQKVDVQDLDCDFLVFSGHKVFAPTGTGILYGKEEILNEMTPYQGGGDMIERVTFERTTYNTLPHKFEAGTPHISGGIGLGLAFEYLNSIDFEGAMQHEKALLKYATEKLLIIDGLRIYGTAPEKASTISFLLDGAHPFDVGVLLDKQGIAVRTGHHCTQPIMDYYGIPGTVRASFAFYNTFDEVDAFHKALERAAGILR
jgi:cysteine desulfurase / selenocysteine lyase